MTPLVDATAAREALEAAIDRGDVLLKPCGEIEGIYLFALTTPSTRASGSQSPRGESEPARPVRSVTPRPAGENEGAPTSAGPEAESTAAEATGPADAAIDRDELLEQLLWLALPEPPSRWTGWITGELKRAGVQRVVDLGPDQLRDVVARAHTLAGAFRQPITRPGWGNRTVSVPQSETPRVPPTTTAAPEGTNQ